MKKLALLGVVLLGLLFLAFPIPRTISLRDLLLLLALLVFGYIAWRNRRRHENPRALVVPAALLAGLTVWIYFVAFFVSPETGWSLGETNSQWLRGVMALLLGAMAALATGGEAGPRRKLLLAVLVPLLLHVLYVDFAAVKILMQHQPLDRLGGLTEGPDKSNYLTNMAFAFLFTELFFRLVHGRRILPFGNAVLGAVTVATLLSVPVERMRNGIIALVVMLLAVGVLYLATRRGRLKRTAHVGIVLAMILVAVGGLGIAATAKQSTSLRNLIATIPIAWDTEHYKAWQDEKKYGWPVLPSGETVDPSAYQRIAWFKEGLILVGEHPLGIGYGRNAYGHGIKAKYGEGYGHSHSGLLDLTIGIGVPGALLWLGFLVSLISLAWRHYRSAGNYAAVLLLLVLIDFSIRMLVDSVIRDHMLQQFMLLAGLAAVLTVAGAPAKRKPSA